MFDYKDVQAVEGVFIIPGRCGEQPIRIGDMIGGCVIMKIEAYQKNLLELSPGMTGLITLQGSHLGTMIVESRPLCFNLEDLRKEKEFLEKMIETLH